MKNDALPIHNWDDLVFENRHKQYGAYAIRRAYSRNMTMAFGISVALTIVTIFLTRFLPASSQIILTPTCLYSGVSIPAPVFTMPRIGTPGVPMSPQKKHFNPYQLPRVIPEKVTEVLPSGEDFFRSELPVEDIDIQQPEVLPVEARKFSEIGEPETISCLFPVATMPVYKGNNEAMMRFIRNNLKYPDKARREGTEGSVFISFIVSAAGKVSDVKVIRGLSAECDEEAVRVVTMMTDWSPAIEMSRAIPVRMVLPITFALIK